MPRNKVMFTRDEIKQHVVECIRHVLDVTKAQASKETNNFVDDFGADSLDCFELVMEYETEFGFAINEEDAKKLTTVKSVIDYIETRKEEITLI